MKIRLATLEDIPNIHQIEKSLEEENAASEETLTSRLQMFPEGFRLAVENTKIVGYAESCRWNRDEIGTFTQIRNFPIHHEDRGKNLYIIFVGVDKNYQRRGIGTSLVNDIVLYSLRNRLNKVQLMSLPSTINLYKKIGFKEVKTCPEFFPPHNCMQMEYLCN